MGSSLSAIRDEEYSYLSYIDTCTLLKVKPLKSDKDYRSHEQSLLTKDNIKKMARFRSFRYVHKALSKYEENSSIRNWNYLKNEISKFSLQLQEECSKKES